MSYNNENAMVEKKNFMIPDMLGGGFTSEDLADDVEGMQLSFRRVKIPGGGTIQFEFPGDNPEDPDYEKIIEGIILFSHANNAYWPSGSEYDDNVTPQCTSFDGKTGCGNPGGACSLCPFNKYGTAVDKNGVPTKGKACKNMRHLYILRNGECMPIVLALPPTSLKSYTDFINGSFVTRNRPTYTGIVQIALKKVDGANPYSVATFRKIYDFAGEELEQITAYAKNFREQIKFYLQERAAEAMNRSDDNPLYEDSEYSSTENGTQFVISSNDTLDGDTDALPM